MLNAVLSSGPNFKPSMFPNSSLFSAEDGPIVVDGARLKATAPWQQWASFVHHQDQVNGGQFAKTSLRDQEVSVRAGAALRFAVNPARVFRSDLMSNQDAYVGVIEALANIVKRAMYFEQALRVRYFRFDGGLHSSPVSGWLHASRGSMVLSEHREDAAGSCCILLKDTVDQDGIALYDFCTAPVLRSVGCGYSPDGTLFLASFVCNDNSIIEIDYDVHLADQTHPSNRVSNISEVLLDGTWQPAAPFNWIGWYNGRSRPTTLRSSLSLSNQYFEKNMRMLTRWFACAHDCGVPEPKQLDWGVRGYFRRFVCDMVARARAGTLPPSHHERLLALDFTCGSKRTHIGGLLECSRYASID